MVLWGFFMSKNKCIAFALGGLGGFNAHGVGFLKAAQDQNITPDIISCTSGQIIWTANYLAGDDIQSQIEAQIDEINVFKPPLDWMNGYLMSLKGDDGIFRPAYLENMMDMMKPMKQFSSREILNRMLPARKFIPERSSAEFERIVDTFNSSKIGVIFNSFWPQSGLEYLHMNDAACKKLGMKYGEKHNDSIVSKIDCDAVEAALWLYFYGFECQRKKEACQIDGAYHRQFIIRELCRSADVIFSVRPQNKRWLGPMPENDLEIKNFTTQLWFNSSYSGETAKVHLINKLLKNGNLIKTKHRPIHLVEIELDVPIEFDQYFVERHAVFQEGYDETYKEINAMKKSGELS